MKPAAVGQRDQRVEMGELVELLDPRFEPGDLAAQRAIVDIS